MIFPFPTESWLSILMYSILIYILYIGIWQIRVKHILKNDEPSFFRKSMTPLGIMLLCLGFLGYFLGVRSAFEAIEIAGDISPSLVAFGFKDAFAYIILGFLGIATTFLFKYLNN